MAVIELKGISKSFKSHVVIDNFSMSVKEGEIVAITGSSGSGKSTLLNIIGLLEDFDDGEYRLFGEENIKCGSINASKMLREKIGYLFQNFALIDDATVRYNLMLALDRVKINKNEKNKLIENALKQVGLNDFCDRIIYTLSGGEQQRVAIARLLLKKPAIILADEPTGSLDRFNRDMILDMLRNLNDKFKSTIIVVTHDREVAQFCDRIIEI